MTTLKPDRRIKHHTADSLSRLLRRKGIAHRVEYAGGRAWLPLLVVENVTPAVAVFLGYYRFTHSAKYALYVRSFKGGK